MAARGSRLQASRPAVAFYLLGATLVAIASLHWLNTAGSDALVAVTAESALVSVFAVTVAYAGRWFDDTGLTDADGRRVLVNSAVFGSLGLVIAVLIIFIGVIKGSSPRNPGYTLALGLAAGTTVGTYAGMYYQQLRRRIDEIEQLNARLEVLQRVLRHNLRNDLTVVSGHLDLLSGADSDGTRDEHIYVLRRRLDSLLELSEKATTIEGVWKADGEIVESDLSTLTLRRISEIRDRYPGVTITADLPERAIAAVHPHVGSAILEAMENACEHNDTTRLELDVAVETNGGVTVRVADTGDGIPSGEIDAIERPMETPLSHASGLGLWLIYWIVDLSNGSFSVTENEPTGTVVELHFPDRNAPGPRTGSPTRPAREYTGSAGQYGANQNP